MGELIYNWIIEFNLISYKNTNQQYYFNIDQVTLHCNQLCIVWIINDLLIASLDTPDDTQAITIYIIVTVIVFILIGTIIVIGILLSIRYLIKLFCNVSISVLGVNEKSFLPTMM